ncbi:hypothetical protein BRC19_00870 [Candidatus Saccharibacteria bacterium QS_5_54_17]|nr:MAG: hypothetical protein BRC19_00870 [Candidatus Saccharibacteria bacterium QS_5_54_17]
MLLKNPRRIHLAKTLTWRVSATVATFLISWAVTGELIIGVTIGIADVALKTVLYYLHERAWFRYAQDHSVQE